MVPAVERAIRILEHLRSSGREGTTLSEMVRLLGLNKSTCHYILKTLERHRYVDLDPDGRHYRLGPALVLLGDAAGRLHLSAAERPVPAVKRKIERGGGSSMFPAEFEYVAPTSVPEAVRLLAEHGYDGKVLAGGQSLIPMMRFRFAQPGVLIDINRIPELRYAMEDRNLLRIGALTRHADLEHSELAKARYPLLSATARWVADPLVRNRGTVSGSLAHADPAGDWGAAMLAARASVVVVGPGGERQLPIDDFLQDTFTTALAPDELLTEIRVPRPEGETVGTYLKIERKVGDFAVVGVALQLNLSEQGEVREAGVGLCAVGPISLRAGKTEEYLVGKRLTDDVIARAGQLAAEESQPVSDQRGPAEYKRDMVRVLTVRGLVALRQQAGRAA